MSEPDELSERLRSFLASLASVEGIETLLLLVRQRGHSLSGEQIARELHVAHGVEPALERLASLNVVDVRLANAVLYRYAPSTPEHEAIVNELILEYERGRLRVLAALEKRSPMTAFAEAFRLRRKSRRDG